MKNVFFALAFMLVGTFAFANNTKEVTTVNYDEAVELINSLTSTDSSNSLKIENNLEVFGTCYITLGFYDSDGNKVYEATLQIEDVDSAEECDEIADEIESQL
jgi:hypothetical protein